MSKTTRRHKTGKRKLLRLSHASRRATDPFAPESRYIPPPFRFSGAPGRGPLNSDERRDIMEM